MLVAFVHQNGFKLTEFDTVSDLIDNSCLQASILSNGTTVISTSKKGYFFNDFEGFKKMILRRYNLPISISKQDYPQPLVFLNKQFSFQDVRKEITCVVSSNQQVAISERIYNTVIQTENKLLQKLNKIISLLPTEKSKRGILQWVLSPGTSIKRL